MINDLRVSFFCKPIAVISKLLKLYNQNQTRQLLTPEETS